MIEPDFSETNQQIDREAMDEQLVYVTGTLDVKLTSSNEADETGVPKAKGHITVNKHQYSPDITGINVVVFDYRSGMFEHRSSYNVGESEEQKDTLASFLNGLPSGKILLMVVKEAVGMNSNLALALQRYGVSASFATTMTTKASMATIAYTGSKKQNWEASHSQFTTAGSSVLEKTIHIFHDLKQTDECSDEMGMRTGRIPDSRISAASIFSSSGRRSAFARLHYRPHYWCAGYHSTVSDYLEVDLGSMKFITGIATQAARGPEDTTAGNFITKFTLQYRSDVGNWYYYADKRHTPKQFDGGSKQIHDDVRINWLPRIYTRYIRVVPTARVTHGDNTHCLRIELFGCTPASPIFYTKGLGVQSDYLINSGIKEEFAFQAISPLSKEVHIAVSTAAMNTSLAQGIDQRHLYEVTLKTRQGPSNLSSTTCVDSKRQNVHRALRESANIECGLAEVDDHSYDVRLSMKVNLAFS